MIQVPNFSIDSPTMGHESNAPILAEPDSSFSFETANQTILRLTNSGFPGPTHPLATSSQSAVRAMQQLVEITTTLHATALAATSSTEHSALSTTPESLVPYVSEEAYEVLETLLTLSDPVPLAPSRPVSLISIQSLIPYLLWSVACSSYTTMQLIEGMTVQRYDPDATWTSGMVRLVVMLTAKTPTGTWCFDLATGCPPKTLLSGQEILRSQDQGLPLWQAPLQTEISAPDQVEGQLQEVLNQIRAAHPAMKPFFEGVQVELLQPGQDWQWGKVQLQLGLEFSAGGSDFTPSLSAWMQADLVEAELLEETAFVTPASRGCPFPVPPAAPVSVIELPRQSLGATTLVCLTEQSTLKDYPQIMTQQQILTAIAYLHHNLFPADPDSQLLQVVRKATEIVQRSQQATDSSLHLEQPVLLMDELIPKLLWHLTRSSYEIMQLMGGVQATVLQPGQNWQNGMLRLLATLAFQGDRINFVIDLATGHILSEPHYLHPDTVCQIHSVSPAIAVSPTDFLPLQPTQAKTLVAAIQQQLQIVSAEISLLMGAPQVEWLEDGQDWQQGSLQLQLGLEFMA